MDIIQQRLSHNKHKSAAFLKHTSAERAISWSPRPILTDVRVFMLHGIRNFKGSYPEESKGQVPQNWENDGFAPL